MKSGSLLLAVNDGGLKSGHLPYMVCGRQVAVLQKMRHKKV